MAGVVLNFGFIENVDENCDATTGLLSGYFVSNTGLLPIAGLLLAYLQSLSTTWCIRQKHALSDNPSFRSISD